MNGEQVSLVMTTWQQVVPIADTAATIFYTKLFEADESLRGLFPEDLSEQKVKLMQTLGRVVSSLDKLQDVLPAVQELGKRHVGYGVKAEDYDTVGGALLDTLQAGLGDAFTPEVKAAWAAAYGTLAGAMIAATGD